jgi:NADPH:quinone reductase-like Zn-dependent oxidoreductase
MMKAAVYYNYGPPEVLRIEEVAKPVPKDNEVLVKVHAATVTSGDFRLRKADPFITRLFFGLTKPRVHILGAEFSGEVEATGKDVKQFKPGDQVFGNTGTSLGTYAEYITISEEGPIALKPKNLSFEEAAGVSFGGNTSLHFLKKGNIRKGDKVLVYGASGSLGTSAVQLAKYFGAEVTGVCSGNNTEMVKSLGADKVVDYTKEDFTRSGEKYDIIYDTVGKSPFSRSVNALKKDGVYLRAVHISLAPVLNGMWVSLTSSKKVIGGVAQDSKENILLLKELLENGKIKPVIDRTFPLDRIAEAHAYAEKGHKRGNVVISVLRFLDGAN